MTQAPAAETSSLLEREDQTRSAGNQSAPSSPSRLHAILDFFHIADEFMESVVYISVSAILGSIVRAYLARLFGKDCETGTVQDFLSPISQHICITSGGRSEQTGGALFYDLPSNLIGSFIMGVITPRMDEPRRARLPWLRRSHILQQDDVYHSSLGVGFCGSLTTFASWNTQMVVMLDGSYCLLGSQVGKVAFGYLMGLICAMAGFVMGRHFGLWLYLRNYSTIDHRSSMALKEEMERWCTLVTEEERHPNVEAIVANETTTTNLVEKERNDALEGHLHKLPMAITAIGLFVAFVIAATKLDIQFYKGMTLLCLVAPFGSLIRWKLGDLNKHAGWIPWGTFCANMTAVTIASIATGINDRGILDNDPWLKGFIFCLNTGLSGSMSTVSSMIKETAILQERQVGIEKAYKYAVGTCLSGMLLGVTIYAIIIRVV